MANPPFDTPDALENRDALSAAKVAVRTPPETPPQSTAKAPSVPVQGGQATPPHANKKTPQTGASVPPTEGAVVSRVQTPSATTDATTPSPATQPRLVVSVRATDTREMYVPGAGLTTVRKGTVYEARHYGPNFLKHLLNEGVAEEHGYA